MTATTTATVACQNGDQYVQKLCKHWSHKLEARYADGVGEVDFSNARAVFTAVDGAVEIAVEARDGETLDRMKGVISSHLDRFAFKEAPLVYDWR